MGQIKERQDIIREFKVKIELATAEAKDKLVIANGSSGIDCGCSFSYNPEWMQMEPIFNSIYTEMLQLNFKIEALRTEEESFTFKPLDAYRIETLSSLNATKV
jgi:hypothetical protein